MQERALSPSRASSTKTRIETQDQAGCQAALLAIKSKFHENKDWNFRLQIDWWLYDWHQEQVPRKQGLKLTPDRWNPNMVHSSRASSTKTRIETHEKTRVDPPGSQHQEQVPRKQGLKLEIRVYVVGGILASRASSTKTRIETHNLCSSTSRLVIIKSKFHENKDWNRYFLQLDYRSLFIKSKFHENKDWNKEIAQEEMAVRWHQEQVPRKQGLKPVLWAGIYPGLETSRASSTKTRIETTCSSPPSRSLTHQEQVPRKQGLKPALFELGVSGFGTSRASSTKTRIETSPTPGLSGLSMFIKSKFHENKDWNKILI